MMPPDRDSLAAHGGARLLRWLLAVLALLACHAPVAAQGLLPGRLTLQLSAADLEARNTAMARALFDEGLRFVDTEQWQEAQDRFGRVLSLRYSAVAAYNWSLSQARLGKGVIASSTLRRILADAGLDTTVRDRATALLGDVEARFAWLNVRVLGECSGCSVYLNEEEWPWAVVGAFVPVDAGHYDLRLRVGNSIVSEERLEIAATARLTATLAPTPDALAAARRSHAGVGEGSRPRAPGEPGQAPAPARGSLLASGWFWGAMGMLAVGAAGAIILETR